MMFIFSFLVVFIYVLGILSWSLNVYRLFQCDFEGTKNWKGEIVRGLVGTNNNQKNMLTYCLGKYNLLFN